MRCRWRHNVKIKHLLTESEEYEDIKKSMKSIKEILEKKPFFEDFDLELFDEVEDKLVLGMTPSEQANQVLGQMYDYADAERIWID